MKSMRRDPNWLLVISRKICDFRQRITCPCAPPNLKAPFSKAWACFDPEKSAESPTIQPATKRARFCLRALAFRRNSLLLQFSCELRRFSNGQSELRTPLAPKVQVDFDATRATTESAPFILYSPIAAVLLGV